eukprot:99158-Chlamydomonas_euryale.AAC.1
MAPSRPRTQSSSSEALTSTFRSVSNTNESCCDFEFVVLYLALVLVLGMKGRAHQCRAQQCGAQQCGAQQCGSSCSGHRHCGVAPALVPRGSI